MEEQNESVLETMEGLTAQMQLARLMNDAGKSITVAGEEMEVRALKPGTQLLIAQQAAEIALERGSSMPDALQAFARCEPMVVRCLALALLNDRDRIYKDYRRKVWSDELLELEDRLEWESDASERVAVLAAVLQMLDLSFFFQATAMLDGIRKMELGRKGPEQE